MVIPVDDYEKAKKEVRGLTCNDCGSPVSLAWGGYYGFNKNVLLCNTNPKEHNNFVRAAIISNYNLPGYNMPGAIRRREKEMTTKIGEEKTRALVKVSGGNIMGVLSRETAIEYAKILFPEAIKNESGLTAIAKLGIICRDYGLNPAMDHVFLVPYKKKDRAGNIIAITWSVVRGIKASRLICGRNKSYGYIDDSPRIMTEDEQKRIYGEVDPLSLVTICKLKDKDGNTFTGYGKWALWKYYKNSDKKYDNQPLGVDKGNTKFNQSCIRAERQALDKLNPGAMPANVDVVDERYVPEVTVDDKIVQVGDQKVDQATGEIISDGDFSEYLNEENIEGEEPAVAGTPADVAHHTEPPPAAEPPKKAPVSKIKPRSEWDKVEKIDITGYPAMEMLFCQLSGMSKSDMYKELGVGGRMDMNIPAWDAFLTLKNRYAPAVPPPA